MTVNVVHWNPSRPVLGGRVGRRLPLRRPVNNFGDLLGPMIVAEVLRRKGLTAADAARPARLVAVGSILHLARDGDTVWGTGVNGKSLERPLPADRLDVRAVRGPLTGQFLRERGHDVPAVYGDPGLLAGLLWPREQMAGRARAVTVIPNLNDLRRWRGVDGLVSPRAPLMSVLSAIASSELVVGSSLHSVVLADAWGIPARLVRSTIEPEFKYRDYYLGSGRSDYRIAEDLSEALRLGGEPGHEWAGAERLLDAFPSDLWSSPHGVTAVSSETPR